MSVSTAICRVMNIIKVAEFNHVYQLLRACLISVEHVLGNIFLYHIADFLFSILTILVSIG